MRGLSGAAWVIAIGPLRDSADEQLLCDEILLSAFTDGQTLIAAVPIRQILGRGQREGAEIGGLIVHVAVVPHFESREGKVGFEGLRGGGVDAGLKEAVELLIFGGVCDLAADFLSFFVGKEGKHSQTIGADCLKGDKRVHILQSPCGERIADLVPGLRKKSSHPSNLTSPSSTGFQNKLSRKVFQPLPNNECMILRFCI